MESQVSKYPIVKVIWVDSSARYGWQPVVDDDDVPLEVTSVGFLLKKTKERLIMASHAAPDGVHSQMHIPRVAIKRVTYL